MSFDVGVGRCSELTDETVTVKLDSVLVHKWFPEEPWRRPGTSLLRFDRRLCSAERPPRVDEEIYVSAKSLSGKATGSLDLKGDGSSRTTVDLRRIVDVQPMPPPAAKPKQSPRR